MTAQEMRQIRESMVMSLSGLLATPTASADCLDPMFFGKLLTSARVEITNPPSPEMICAALVLLTENGFWPGDSNPTDARSTEATDALAISREINVLSDILARHTDLAKTNSPDYRVIQITLAYLNGWSRPAIRSGAKTLSGIPRPAMKEMLAYIQESVDNVINYFLGRDTDNKGRLRGILDEYEEIESRMDLDPNQRKRALDKLLESYRNRQQQFEVKSSPRVLGFPRGLSPRSLAVKVYHRFIAKAEYAQCRHYLNTAPQQRKIAEKTCKERHNLGKWEPSQLPLSEFLQQAVKGSFGGIKPGGFDSGMLLSILRLEVAVSFRKIVVWHHCQPMGMGNYLMHKCNHCDHLFVQATNPLTVQRMWIRDGDESHFECVKMWRCHCAGNNGAEHYFVASKLNDQGEPDTGVNDQCPLSGTRHGDNWASLWRFKQDLAPEKVIRVFDRCQFPVDPEQALSLDEKFYRGLTDLPSRCPAWVPSLLEAAYNDWRRNPTSDLFRLLFSDDPAWSSKAYSNLRELISDIEKPPLLNETFLKEWSVWRTHVTNLLKDILRPPGESEKNMDTNQAAEDEPHSEYR